MDFDVDQHKTYIRAPDDSAKVVRDAIPPPAQPKVVIPGPTDRTPGALLKGKGAAARRGKLYGMSLARRGLSLLGATFGAAGIWFVSAWIRHGRMPLGLFPPPIISSFCVRPDPVWPPAWLVVILGLMLVASLFMIVLGTQDHTPGMRRSAEG